jgi:hypothetical protein
MREHPRALPGLLIALVVVLAAVGLLVKQPAANAQNRGGGWNPVTVLYLSDTRGKIEPCG